MTASETWLVADSLGAMTCWLALIVVHPRSLHLVDARAAHENEYLHQLGRQRRLTLLAAILTAAALVLLLTLPATVDPDLRDLRWANDSCGKQESPYDTPTCYAMQPGGGWVIEELRSDGTRWVIATVAHPDFTKRP